MGTPQHGVLVQIQLLRSYADPSAKTASGRFISAPSDRAGQAPLWEYFGGHNCPCGKLIWASADGYGIRIIQMYSQALAESGKAGACVAYAPPVAGTKSGNGLLGRHARLGRASVRCREVPRRHAQPPPRRAAHRRRVAVERRRATGCSHATAASSRTARRASTARRARCASNKPVNGMERTQRRRGLLARRRRRRHLLVRQRALLRLDGRQSRSTSPCSAWSARASGKGYWLFAVRRRHLQLRRRALLRFARRLRSSLRRSCRCSARRPARATG